MTVFLFQVLSQYAPGKPE